MLVEKRDATERLPFQKPLLPIGSSKFPTHSGHSGTGSNVSSDRSLVVHETKGTNHVQDIVERGWGTRKVEYEQPGSSRLYGLVGTVTGDVSFRTTGVASAPLGLGAVLTDMAKSRTIVTLGTLHAVARKVPNTTTRVAGLLATSPESVVASITVTATAAAAAAAIVGTSGARWFGAGAGNMAHLPALVALLTASAAARRGGLRAFTRNVTFLTTLVAGFGFWIGRAVSGDVPFLAAVVASRGSGLWAVGGLVTESTTVKASACTRHVVMIGCRAEEVR